jgi:hypothetical protein
MRNASWALITLAFVLAFVALGLQIWGNDGAAMFIKIGFAVTLLLGVVVLTISACIRLARRELLLRPWDAMRKAVLIFLIVFGIRSLIELIAPGFGGDLRMAALHSAGFAIVYGLYTTAYRKPA